MPPTLKPVRRSASAGFIICADLPPKAAASFFMLTSRSDGTTTQTGLPSTSAIRVLNTCAGRLAQRLGGLEADRGASGS